MDLGIAVLVQSAIWVLELNAILWELMAKNNNNASRLYSFLLRDAYNRRVMFCVLSARGAEAGRRCV